MKTFAVGLLLIAGVTDALKGITVRAPAPAAACHTSLGPRNPALAGISLEELKAEIAKRELPCQPAPAPSPSGPVPAPGPAPPMAVCTTVDGTAASTVYPCVCTGGAPAAPAPAPPPGAAPAAPPEPTVCEDESRHCLAGECVHPACTHTDGTSPATTTLALVWQVAHLQLQHQVHLVHQRAMMIPSTASLVCVFILQTILLMSWLIKPTLISTCLTPTRMDASRMLR